MSECPPPEKSKSCAEGRVLPANQRNGPNYLDCMLCHCTSVVSTRSDQTSATFIGTGKYAWNGNREKGDCSILILNASVERDDGEWECQVGASTLELDDPRTSHAARLLVRVAPLDPIIEYQSSSVSDGGNITVVAHRNTSVQCLSRHGSPAAVIKWYLGSEDVTGWAEQKNISNKDYPKKYDAVSILQLTLVKEQNSIPLKCIAMHEAYKRKVNQIQVKADVQYLPVVTLEKSPIEDVEDGKDSVKLVCNVDANPAAFILWKKDGRDLSVDNDLVLNPIHKDDGGLYTCQGSNSLGSSEPASVHLDIKYSPTNVRVLPGGTQAKVHNQTSLICMADGNPPPRFIWLFSANGEPSAAQIKGVEATLHIDNVTYDAQGTYVCMAANSIKGEERTEQSEEVKIDVFGIPQIISSATSRSSLHVEKGEDAILEVPFCSDPPPKLIIWEWGEGLKLQVGEGRGKYIAEQLSSSSLQPTDCYDARLVVQKADMGDARSYLLTVENERGRDSTVVSLAISEPVSMSTVIGLVIGCLIVLVIVVLIILYAFRAEKWCFRIQGLPYWLSPFPMYATSQGMKFDFEVPPPGSPTIDLSNGRPGSSVDTRKLELEAIRNRLRPSLGSRAGAIPPDALYTLPPKRSSHSEENTHQNDHNENKNSTRDVDYTEVEVPKIETRVSNSHSDYRPQPHEVADI
uniref:Ig-like domain-containing protein n=1 Tax=Strigamia maritima TaxID=126957 RepID=T1IW79_STRMM